MEERGEQQDRKRAHSDDGRAMICSLPTEEQRESIYWMDFEEYFTFEGDNVLFASNTPERVISSYRLWESRQRS